jgi:hypothetical protein
MSYSTSRFASDLPDGVQWLALAVVLELGLLLVYILTTGAHFTTPRYVLYPFVWINVGIWAAVKTTPRRVDTRHQLVAVVIAVFYFLVLAYFAGLFGFVTNAVPESLVGITVGQGSPGWERVRVVAPPYIFISFIPYRVIGYVALSYLVYAAVVDATSAALSGALGVVSCISCSFPIVASLLTGLMGGTTALTATAIYAYSVDISTAIFLLSVALLYWRPGFDAFR